MRITKVEPQKRNKKRVNIYINDRFAFGVHEDIAYSLHLEEDAEIDREYIERVVMEEEQNRANNYALNLLAFRSRTEKEIRDKMRDKEYDQAVISSTIETLKRIGLLDDTQYAKNFANDKANFNKFGNGRIRFELAKKGVSREIIEEVLEDQSGDEYERALETAKRKLNSYKSDDKNAIYRKLGGFLQRKGYSYDIVSSVLKELVK